MTSTELLDWYRNQTLLLRALDQNLNRLGHSGAPAAVRAQQYTSEPHGTNDPSAAALQAWEGLLERRSSYAQALVAQRPKALEIINSAVDCRIIMILTLYYLQAMTDQEIANQLLISREHVNRLRRSAMKALH